MAEGKKSILPVLLIVFGIIGVVCIGVCGFAFYKIANLGIELINGHEQFIASVGKSDFDSAYKMTSAGFQSRVTKEQFIAAMKAAKLHTNKGMVNKQPTQSPQGNVIGYTYEIELADGKSTTVTLKYIQTQFMKFSLDDVIGPDIDYDGEKKPKIKDDKKDDDKKDDKKKPVDPDEDK